METQIQRLGLLLLTLENLFSSTLTVLGYIMTVFQVKTNVAGQQQGGIYRA